MQDTVQRLDSKLDVIRKIYELIIYEKNKENLIKRICEKIIEFGGYHYSLIVLLDESKNYITHSEKGLLANSELIINELKNGNFPECMKSAFKSCSYFRETDNNFCKDCFNNNEFPDKRVKILKLESNGYLFGILYVVAEGEIFRDKEELKLINDISKDLGYALHNIEESEKKYSGNRLAESDKLYRTITDNIRDGLIITKDDGIVFVNRKICEIFGCSEEKIIKSTIFELVGSEAEGLIKEYNNNRVPEDLEFWIKRKDGKRKFLRYRSTIIKNYINSRLIVITNITGKKKNEEKIQQQQEYFKQLFENSPLGIVMMDNKTRILKTNQGFEKMFQYNSSETAGKFLKEVIMPDELKNQIGSTERVISLGKRIHEETIRKRKDNSIIDVERLCYPIIIDNKIAGAYAIYFDITERKQAEQVLKNAKEKAEENERMKSNFLAQMSHEIRTPINSILSFINLIKDEVQDKLPEDLNSAFSFIDTGSRRLIRTIDLILNMSQIQNGKYRPEFDNINLYDDVVRPVFEEFTHTAREKSLLFNLHSKHNEPYIYGDPYTLSQVFQNLIDNAIKFTEKGNVDVIIYQNESGAICVDVTDTGVGISDVYLHNLFMPFSQEETGYTRKFEGNGLGLALVKKYIEINNAKIFVKSQKGKGSTFSIEFMNFN